MVIGIHPGPVGEIFYCDHQPSGHANPARFASIQGLFSYYFRHRHKGWQASALYVTDYSALNYSVKRSGGHQVITVTGSDSTTNSGSTTGSAATTAAGMTDAKAATYVVDSDVNGVMGTAIVPFSAKTDATSFARKYHGHVRSFAKIDSGVLASGGQ